MSGTLRSQLDLLRAQLFTERSTFEPHWRDLGEYILPRRPRFFVTDVNNGDRRNQKIIDSTATMAARTLASGMMSGVTSPSRPWFRLSTGVRDFDELGEVRRWLNDTRDDILRVFNKSNLYNVLPIVYGDLGVFGTACMMIEEDFTDNVVHFRSFPVGSYFLGVDEKGRVNVFMREFMMNARQIIEKFATDVDGKIDFDVVTTQIRDAYKNGHTEQWFYVTHVIRPNPNYDPTKSQSKYKKYQSVYYEQGLSKQHFSGQSLGSPTTDVGYGGDDEKVLRERGYDFFPIFAPRWAVTGEDVYGTDCPGMVALGDIKALQLMHKRKAQALEKKVNPPLVAPPSLKNKATSMLPGDITYLDEGQATDRLRPLHEVQFQLSELYQDIQEHQMRVQRACYEDLFLMLARSDRRQITAREIEERHEEKLLALGPVLEQINQDLLDPLIDVAFGMMVEREGLIGPPPEELQGVDLKVEYISIMAQAQKTIGVSSVERFVGFVGQMAGFDPSVADKLDTNKIIDNYGDMVSVDPNMVRTDEEVEAIRQQRAQAQAQQQQAQSLKDSASAAKDLSQAQIGNDGTNVLQMLTGGA